MRLMRLLEQEDATDAPKRKPSSAQVGRNNVFGALFEGGPCHRWVDNLYRCRCPCHSRRLPGGFSRFFATMKNLRVLRIPFAELDWRGCLKWPTALEKVEG